MRLFRRKPWSRERHDALRAADRLADAIRFGSPLAVVDQAAKHLQFCVGDYTTARRGWVVTGNTIHSDPARGIFIGQ